jgi:hypothetical protein
MLYLHHTDFRDRPSLQGLPAVLGHTGSQIKKDVKDILVVVFSVSDGPARFVNKGLSVGYKRITDRIEFEGGIGRKNSFEKEKGLVGRKLVGEGYGIGNRDVDISLGRHEGIKNAGIVLKKSLVYFLCGMSGMGAKNDEKSECNIDHTLDSSIKLEIFARTAGGLLLGLFCDIDLVFHQCFQLILELVDLFELGGNLIEQRLLAFDAFFDQESGAFRSAFEKAGFNEHVQIFVGFLIDPDGQYRVAGG